MKGRCPIVLLIFLLNWTASLCSVNESIKLRKLILILFHNFKRHEEIPPVKMFNPNLYKNQSYDMNFMHKNMSYMPL